MCFFANAVNSPCNARLSQQKHEYRFERSRADVSALTKTCAVINDKHRRGLRNWIDTTSGAHDVNQPWTLSLDGWTNFHRPNAHALVLRWKRDTGRSRTKASASFGTSGTFRNR
jgi:hypothetical protein